MSRVAKKPIVVPSGVEMRLEDATIVAKGSQGTNRLTLHKLVQVHVKDNIVSVVPTADSKQAWAIAGTMRALIQNLLTGVSTGFKVELELRGVGYKVRLDGKKLILSLGYSHEVIHALPDGVNAEAPSQTALVLKGMSLEEVTLQAAKIRSYREPENYKGKGIRYLGEKVLIKETSKKK